MTGSADIGTVDRADAAPVPARVVAGDEATPRRQAETTVDVRSTRRRPVGVLAFTAVLASVPFVTGEYYTSNVSQILAFTILVYSLQVVQGWGGMYSLGQAVYFGAAGYAVGILGLDHGITSAPVLLLVGAIAGAIMAALTGWMVVRTAGGYLYMLTLAIAELMAYVALSWRSVTHGDDGLAAIPFTTVGSTSLKTPTQVYWYVLIVFLLMLGLMHLLNRSPFGRTMRGIRDNERRMRSVGYGTRVYKYVGFCVGGMIAGTAGAVWITQTRFVSPSDVGIRNSSLVLVALAVGGAGRLWGPVVGSALIICSQNLLPPVLVGKGPLVLGVVLVLSVYLMPGGVSELPDRLNRFRGRQR